MIVRRTGALVDVIRTDELVPVELAATGAVPVLPFTGAPVPSALTSRVAVPDPDRVSAVVPDAVIRISADAEEVLMDSWVADASIPTAALAAESLPESAVYEAISLATAEPEPAPSSTRSPVPDAPTVTLAIWVPEWMLEAEEVASRDRVASSEVIDPFVPAPLEAETTTMARRSLVRSDDPLPVAVTVHAAPSAPVRTREGSSEAVIRTSASAEAERVEDDVYEAPGRICPVSDTLCTRETCALAETWTMALCAATS